MKRFAALALSAGFFWAGNTLPAADTVPLPPPTGMAPTSPQVPVPVLSDGLPVLAGEGSRTKIRDRFGCGVNRKSGCDGEGCVGRFFSRFPGLSLFGKKEAGAEPYDPYVGKQRWCTDCAPAVRQPLPPLPADVGIKTVGDRTVGVRTVDQAAVVIPVGGGGSCAGGACSDGTCATGGGGHGAGHCLHKFMGWLCYRQTPYHWPITPNQRMPPTYTYFPCHDRGACATGSCGAGGCATGVGGPVGRMGLSNRGGGVAVRETGGSCKPCPQAGEAIMPGYRLANPVTPVADGQPVVTSSYRPPEGAPGPAKTGGPMAPDVKPIVRPFPQP